MSEPTEYSPKTDSSDAEPDFKEQVLDALGGWSGMVYSSLPVVVFVPANALWKLNWAIAAALAVAAIILVVRLVRKENIQPAISGFVGVGVCALVAYVVGSAKGYFLYGIYTQLVFAVAFLVSILVRWPLVGVIYGFLTQSADARHWRTNRALLHTYDALTVLWVLVFMSRFLLQNHLYHRNDTGWLGITRIAMGWPMTGVAVLVTFLLVRLVDNKIAPGEPAVTEAPHR